MKFKDVMIDLETLGNGKNACVVQIGACYFDRVTGQIGDTLRINIDARDAVKSGAELEADTVYWWLSQDKKAIDSITQGDLLKFIPAFTELNEFLKDAANIWSHATFDFVIVTESMKRIGMKPLFSYRAARDIRTLVELSGVNTKAKVRAGVHHDALDDCKYQVAYCVEALNKIQGGTSD